MKKVNDVLDICDNREGQDLTNAVKTAERLRNPLRAVLPELVVGRRAIGLATNITSAVSSQADPYALESSAMTQREIGEWKSFCAGEQEQWKSLVAGVPEQTTFGSGPIFRLGYLAYLEWLRESPGAVAASPKYDELADRILTKHYLDEVANMVDEIGRRVGEPTQPVFANRLLGTLLRAEEELPNRPLTRFLLALYDCLACDHRWAAYSVQDYVALGELIKSIHRYPVSHDVVERAIVRLDSMGFETLPYTSDGADVSIPLA